MKLQYLTAAVASSLMLAYSSQAQVVTNAYDNANLSAYSPPNNNWSSINGGSGFNLWTALAGATGGGVYMDGTANNNREVDGSDSFALYGGSGSYAISRPLSSSITAGSFSILTRFDLAGINDNLVSLRTGNTVSSFGAGELLSFGISGSHSQSQLGYTDSTGFHQISSGESRGDVWAWNINFDASLGTYSGSVTNMGGGFATTFSGNLDSSSTSVGSFAVINSSGSAGGSQNLVFDSPTLTTIVVPEPSTLAIAGLSGLAALLVIRRRRA